jgi:hypothetical protein
MATDPGPDAEADAPESNIRKDEPSASVAANVKAPDGSASGVNAPGKQSSPPEPRLPSETWKQWVDILNKSLQIAAILVAGVWAGSVFWETVKPALDPKLNVTGDITWTMVPDTDFCEAHFTLNVKNPGPRSVDVESATVRIWVTDLSTEKDTQGNSVLEPLEAKANPIDVKLLTGDDNEAAEKRVVYKSGTLDPLFRDIVGPYLPMGESQSSQIILFKKNAHAFTLIKVDLSGSGSIFFGSKHLDNYGYAMDRVCGANAYEKKNTSKEPASK